MLGASRAKTKNALRPMPLALPDVPRHLQRTLLEQARISAVAPATDALAAMMIRQNELSSRVPRAFDPGGDLSRVAQAPRQPNRLVHEPGSPPKLVAPKP